MPPKKFPCLVCDKDVGGKTGSVQCNFCDKWVHPACGGISKPHLDILIENPSTTWTCKPCFGVSSKIKKEVQVLALKQEQSRKEIQANKEEIERVKVRMDTVEKKVEEINRDEIIKQGNEIVFRELRERESRKNNLVIHKVPELVGDSVTTRDRREHDVRRVLEVFEFLDCIVPREDIKFIYRPGDKIDSAWPRPVILSLKDPGARHYLLNNASKLANSAFSSISVVPDLTPQQRNEEEGLRKEATKRNAELDSEEAGNWEWVTVGLRGQKRLIKRRIVEGRGRGRNEQETRKRQERTVGPPPYLDGATRGTGDGQQNLEGRERRRDCQQGNIARQRGNKPEAIGTQSHRHNPTNMFRNIGGGASIHEQGQGANSDTGRERGEGERNEQDGIHHRGGDDRGRSQRGEENMVDTDQESDEEETDNSETVVVEKGGGGERTPPARHYPTTRCNR